MQIFALRYTVHLIMFFITDMYCCWRWIVSLQPMQVCKSLIVGLASLHLCTIASARIVQENHKECEERREFLPVYSAREQFSSEHRPRSLSGVAGSLATTNRKCNMSRLLQGGNPIRQDAVRRVSEVAQSASSHLPIEAAELVFLCAASS